MSDCRRKVEAAIRRHRALAGKPFPNGDCGQDDCIHTFVLDLMVIEPLKRQSREK